MLERTRDSRPERREKCLIPNQPPLTKTQSLVCTLFLNKATSGAKGSNVLILWDNLPAHHAVDAYFTDERPDWFEFEYFPPYSPELNPVEFCWNKMKNDYLPNFVPTTDEELIGAVEAAANRINDEKKMIACFNVAGMPP